MRKKAVPAILALVLAAGCAAAPGAMVRKGVIRLGLENGKSIAFHDDADGCERGDPDHCTVYRLQPAPPGCGCFSISEAFFEGGSDYLIDAKNGRRTRLPFAPIFSADGRTILILNNDVTGDFPGDRIEIWRRQGDTAVKEWAHSPDEKELGSVDYVWEMNLVRWDGDIIRVRLVTNDHLDRNHQLQPGEEWDGVLRHGPDGWHAELRKPERH